MILPLEVNDPIQVQATDSSPGHYCDSRVEEMAAGELLIRWPVHAGERMRVRQLQTLRISYTRSQTVYEFDAAVLDVIEDPFPLLSVRPSGSIRSVQRREDVRIRAHAPVELYARVVGLALYKNIRTHYNIKSETFSLSAGGFSIHHSAAIPEGTLFEVKIALPGDSAKIATNAQVANCRSQGEPGAQPAVYEIGFTFMRLGQSARARIVKFIFGLQREEKLDD